MSSASPCTPSGIMTACDPTPTSPAPALASAPAPQFDDSTVGCDSSAVVGSSLNTVQIIIRQNCDSSADVKKDTGAPIVVTTTADDLNTITLQVGRTFENDNSNFTLSDENCSSGFMYAITKCSNSDRPLISGGSAAPTYSGLPVSFEASVLYLRSRKRDDSSTAISIALKPFSSSLGPSRAVVPASSMTPSPLSTATETDPVQGHGDATNKTDLRRRNTTNFVVCDTSGPTAKLSEMHQVTDTFCNKYNRATLNNEETVTATYLLSGGNARVSAKS
ncbi:Hypothetical predicted protein [Lecanosticta acicola]|uniref:Uncharacterized protein n=1 Tax=Lecanosticta acicola TaxID=111012 RepID=A0AAI8VV17_9PEZI|nr:Hypothetical predicted protein [Lecanosticta acicola]